MEFVLEFERPIIELQKRIEAFVGSFRQTLSRLSDAELKAKQEALAQQQSSPGIQGFKVHLWLWCYPQRQLGR